jgi:hypothetical protein
MSVSILRASRIHRAACPATSGKRVGPKMISAATMMMSISP